MSTMIVKTICRFVHGDFKSPELVRDVAVVFQSLSLAAKSVEKALQNQCIPKKILGPSSAPKPARTSATAEPNADPGVNPSTAHKNVCKEANAHLKSVSACSTESNPVSEPSKASTTATAHSGPVVCANKGDEVVTERKHAGDVFSIAPMMEVTDRYFRTMVRSLTKRTRLYTEMVVDDTVLHQMSNLQRFLGFDPVQHPVAIQLGGSNPEQLAKVAGIAEEWGYDEIDLNCGCPSAKVSARLFGARLMLEPDRVRRICAAIRRRVQVPVTVKCRLGADDCNSYEELCHFVETVSSAGITHFIVHARICLLSGLSTKANRNVPPLKYDWVYRLAADYPHLEFSLNGGVETLEEVKSLLRPKLGTVVRSDGTTAKHVELNSVMVGRGAYKHPGVCMLARADSFLFDDPSVVPGAKGVVNTRSSDTRSSDAVAASPGAVLSRRSVVMDYLDHFQDLEERKELPTVHTHHFVRPLTYMFRGMRAGKQVAQKINKFSREYQKKFPPGSQPVVPVVSQFMQKLMNDFRIPKLIDGPLYGETVRTTF